MSKESVYLTRHLSNGSPPYWAYPSHTFIQVMTKKLNCFCNFIA